MPTKSGGQWGYINTSKKWVIAPKFDYCLPFDGRDFTWVKKGEQSLLIDRTGKSKKTLPFNAIADIFGDIITYREDNLLGWFNKQTNALVEAQYSNLSYKPSTNHFVTSDTQFYTVVDLDNKKVIALDSISHIVVDNFYFVTRLQKTGVYSTTGTNLIPLEYANVDQFEDYFIAQDPDGYKHIYTKEGTLIYSGLFTGITPIYGPYFQCARDDKFYLLESTSGDLIDSTRGRYSFFRNGIIDIKNKNGRGLYNVNLRKRIVEPHFVNLFNQNGSDFIITYDGALFGLVDSAGNTPSEKRYVSIGPFVNNVCIVRDISGWYGLIGNKAQTLLPSKYSFLSVGNDGVTKGKQDSIFFLYEFDAQGQMLDSMRFNRTGTLRLGGRISMSMVSGRRSVTQQISQYWFQDDKGKWGLKDPTGYVQVKPIYDEVQKLRGTNLVLGKVFASRSAKLTRRMGIMSTTTYGVVDEQRFRPVLLSGIMYIDTSALADDNLDVMRVIAGGGYFSTINIYSGRMLRYETKYIDRFVNGYARIFMGSKLVLTATPKLNYICNANSYLREFGFTARGTPLSTWKLSLAGLGYWAYLGPDGKFIASPKHFEKQKIMTAENFSNGRAIVQDKSGNYGMINENAAYVLQPIYKHISFLPNTGDSLVKTIARVKRYGYVAESGRVVSHVQYSKAQPFISDATWCFSDGTTSLLRADGTQDTFHGRRHVSPMYNGYGGIAEKRKMAIITSDAELLSTYTYSRLGKYSENLQPAKKSKVFGYLNDNGEWEIEPQFYKAGPFINGVALVKYQPVYGHRKYYGYIDKNGEFLLKGKFTKATDINEDGYAIVRKGNLKGVVNSSGKLIIKPKYTKVYYGEGYFTTFQNGITTLHNSEEKKIKKVRGSRIKGGVSDGKQVIKRIRKVGAIDTNGKKVVDYQYFNLAPFEKGFSVNQRRRTTYLLHQDGDTVTFVPGRAVGGFSSEYVLIKNGRNYYFVNHSGQNTFNLIFQDATPFVDGLALVKIAGKWGMIDKDGFYRIQPHYDFIEEPSNGISIVGLNETAGICDLNAFYLVAPRCNSVTYLPNEKVYRYSFKNEFGYIDTKGNIIWDVE